VPVSVDPDHDGCDGFAVTEPDGSIAPGGCHGSRREAEGHRDAINASKDMSDHTDRLLALAEDVSEGDRVEWDSQGDRKARGIVQRVVEEGLIDVPDSDFTVEAPAALIEVYEPTGDGYVPTGDMVGHQLETLGQTDFSVAEEEAADIALSDMQRLHIFRAGTHHGANGSVIDYTEEDVQAIADLYDPDLHEAPLVVGHPSDNQPAFGWVDSLAANGADLRAKPRQVEQSFADAVREGRFKKISASFYPPGHPNHPVPSAGEPYLRHVGFLGAKAPAVKGLETPQLSDDGDLTTVTFDLSDPDDMASGGSDARTLLQRLAEMLGVSMTQDAQEKGEAGDNTGGDARDELERLQDADMTFEGIAGALSDMNSDFEEDVTRSAGILGQISQEEIDNPPQLLVDALSQIEPPEDTEDASESTDSNDMPDETDQSPEDTSTVEELAERLDDLEQRLDEKDDTIEDLQEELEDEREARKEAEEKAAQAEDLSEAEQELRQRDIEDAVQDAAENGRIHSKHVPLWQSVLELAEGGGASVEEATIDFADVEVGGEEAKDLRETLEYIMNHQGPVVVLGEVADGSGEADPVDFSDADSLRHAAKQEQERVKEETGEEIRYAEAMDNVLQRRDS